MKKALSLFLVALFLLGFALPAQAMTRSTNPQIHLRNTPPGQSVRVTGPPAVSPPTTPPSGAARPPAPPQNPSGVNNNVVVNAAKEALNTPAWVNNGNTFMSWLNQQSSAQNVFNAVQVMHLQNLANHYGIAMSVNAAHGPNHAPWTIPHLHFGNNRIHIAIDQPAFNWISSILGGS